MGWHVADSYSNGTIVGEVFEKNGRNYVKIKDTCGRCGGSGSYGPLTVDHGKCFECGGTGYVFKVVRAYNDREYANYTKAKARAEEKRITDKLIREEEKERKSEDNLAKALVKCGIREDGVAFICKGDTFSIKDDLKEHGFRFNPVLMWYAATNEYCPEGYELAEVQVKDYIDWHPQLLRFDFKESAKNDIRKKLAPPSNFSSETVGAIKERLRDLRVKFLGGRGFEGAFGYTHIYRFVDPENHLFTWFTTKELDYEENESLLLTGTVKSFSDYNGEISTVVTRCVIKGMS